MKKFAGTKPLNLIKQQCKEQGVHFNDEKFRLHGSDHVVVGGFVVFNTFNGKFFGTHPDGFGFDSSSTKHENESWFQALLNFFYIEKMTTIQSLHSHTRFEVITDAKPRVTTARLDVRRVARIEGKEEVQIEIDVQSWSGRRTTRAGTTMILTPTQASMLVDALTTLK